MKASENSVTMMLAQLKGGDEAAAREIWHRFFDRVTSLAHKKLGALPKRVLDEEDIALSAMNALYCGVRDGRFSKLHDRDDLWQILCMLTARKAASAWRKQKSARLVGESVMAGLSEQELDALGLQQIADCNPDSDYLDGLNHQCRELLEGMDERLTRVATLRLQGYSNQEIADDIGRSVKSVERYLQTIREQWLNSEG
ncbi:MAG: ECF-type sigma factor [bacterium]|nr:ECF-type sigma factor [bacterium]